MGCPSHAVNIQTYTTVPQNNTSEYVERKPLVCLVYNFGTTLVFFNCLISIRQKSQFLNMTEKKGFLFCALQCVITT